MSGAVGILVGVVVGAAIVWIVVMIRRGQEREFAQRLLDDVQAKRAEELSATVGQLEATFAKLSKEALSGNTDDFLKLATTKLEQQTVSGEKSLEGKKKLIDARLEEMGSKLVALNTLMVSLDKERVGSHRELKGQIEQVSQATSRLQATTGKLHEALSSSQQRGQWGERMAEDVLRLAGFVEGINYEKQKQIESGTRPDFTFMLPGDRCVHMDVKFPLANYMGMLEADDEATRKATASKFVRDVRSRVKEVTTRDYIDPAAGTVDYCIVFIPNEQVYGFIHELDGDLLDFALRSKVVLCSPMTLYAILAVIRQSVENFRLEQNAKQILELLAGFKKQWGKYAESMDSMGKKLKEALEKYEHLTTTRTRLLERQLDKIDDLQARRDEGAASLPDGPARAALSDD